MEAKKIKTIEMTRKIRDKHAKRLAGKTHAEQIAFYREQAEKMEKKLPVLLSEISIASKRKSDFSNAETISNKSVKNGRATKRRNNSNGASTHPECAVRI